MESKSEILRVGALDRFTAKLAVKFSGSDLGVMQKIRTRHPDLEETGAVIVEKLSSVIFRLLLLTRVLYVYVLCGGVGGNLVAVQASRLSTALHCVSTPGVLPDSAVHGCPSPLSTFFSTSTW